MTDYHDKEWGVPVHDDKKLFEFLILEGAQAGLSWSTILKRRHSYKKAFSEFDPKEVAKFTEAEVTLLLKDEGIIRNKLKIKSAINNAQKFLEVKKEFDSFDNYLWGFVDGKPIVNAWPSIDKIPIYTRESEIISSDLKKRGFTFVGPTIAYAYMQAVGVVNDHTTDCFRYQIINSNL